MAYFAPVQIEGKPPTRQVDIFAAGVLLWEVLAGKRLFAADNEAATLARIVALEVPPVSTLREGVTPALDAVIAKALAREAGDRFASAEEMADAIEAASPPASPRTIARWVTDIAGARISERAVTVAEVERSGTGPTLIGPATSEPSSAAVVIASPKKKIAIGAAGITAVALVAVVAAVTLHARSRTESVSATPSVSFTAEPSAPSSVAHAPDTPPPAASSAAAVTPKVIAPTRAAPRPTTRATAQPQASAMIKPEASPDAGKPTLYGRD